MQPQEDTERTLPDSNTLGGTSSTGAGPDGQNDSTPPPETPGPGLDDTDAITKRIQERNDPE